MASISQIGVGCLAALAAAAPAAAAQRTLSVGAVSQYVFRGLAQTDGQPAVQGGAGYALDSGLYAGTWASSIRWVDDSYPGVTSPVEWDVYAGYQHGLAHGLTLDTGVARYQYPGRYLPPPPGAVRPDFTELFVAVSKGVVSLKYSHSVTDANGVERSLGSRYLDLAINWPVTHTFAVALHGGHMAIAGRNALTQSMATDNASLYSYDDASATLNWNPRPSWTLSATVTVSTARDAGYMLRGRNLGDPHIVFGLSYGG